MAGDELCAVLFYKVATFIWRSNEIQGDEMREYQDALITHVLGYNYKQDFIQKLRSSLSVVSWDGSNQIRLEATYIERMVKEILLLGDTGVRDLPLVLCGYLQAFRLVFKRPRLVLKRLRLVQKALVLLEM